MPPRGLGGARAADGRAAHVARKVHLLVHVQATDHVGLADPHAAGHLDVRIALSNSSTRHVMNLLRASASPRNARLCSRGTHRSTKRRGRDAAFLSTPHTHSLACFESSSSCWCSIWFSALTMHPRRCARRKTGEWPCRANERFPIRYPPSRAESGLVAGPTIRGRLEKLSVGAFLTACAADNNTAQSRLSRPLAMRKNATTHPYTHLHVKLERYCTSPSLRKVAGGDRLVRFARALGSRGSLWLRWPSRAMLSTRRYSRKAITGTVMPMMMRIARIVWSSLDLRRRRWRRHHRVGVLGNEDGLGVNLRRSAVQPLKRRRVVGHFRDLRHGAGWHPTGRWRPRWW